MLDNDVLVPHTCSSDVSYADVVDYFNSVMPGFVSSFADTLLVMASYCGYISYEEIILVFPCIKVETLKKVVSRLVKQGLLVKTPLNKMEGLSKVYFSLSKEGYKKALEAYGGMLPQKNKSGSSSSYIHHSYSVGLNFIHMLSLNIPIDWRRDVPDSYADVAFGRKYVGNASVWTDAVCSVYPGELNRYRLVYFEQDMLNESNEILFNKLRDYHKTRLMSYSSDMIVFSFRQKGVSKEPNSKYMRDVSFSVSNCMELYNLLEQTKCDAFELLGYSGISLSFKEYIVSFLTRIGGIKKIHGENGVEYKSTGIKADAGFVKEYLSGLANLNNPYVYKSINTIHSRSANLRLFYAARYLLSRINDLPDYAMPLLGGFQVLYVTTNLVCNHIPYAMLSLFPGFIKQISDILKDYFDNPAFISELSERIDLTESRFIRFRNVFSYEYGVFPLQEGRIAVEFPSMDLGAWLRIYLYYNLYKGDAPYQIVCFFDTKEQHDEFFKALRILVDQKAEPDKISVIGIIGSI